MTEKMSKVCANCKNDNNEGDRYCRYCGAPLDKPDYIAKDFIVEDFAVLYGSPEFSIQTCKKCGYSWKVPFREEQGCPRCGFNASVSNVKKSPLSRFKRWFRSSKESSDLDETWKV